MTLKRGSGNSVSSCSSASGNLFHHPWQPQAKGPGTLHVEQTRFFTLTLCDLCWICNCALSCLVTWTLPCPNPAAYHIWRWLCRHSLLSGGDYGPGWRTLASSLSPVPLLGVSFANTMGKVSEPLVKSRFTGNSFSFFFKLFPNSYMNWCLLLHKGVTWCLLD